MTIAHHKRQARLRAAAASTSLQSELNAIAHENGHAAWGDFQKTFRSRETASNDATSQGATRSGEEDGTPSDDKDAKRDGRRPDEDRIHTVFRSTDPSGSSREMDWNLAKEKRDPAMTGMPFVPAFNALAPSLLPNDAHGLEFHVERIARILLPEGVRGMDHFDKRGQRAMVGLLLFEIGRAGVERRTPSIPSAMDWIWGGLRVVLDEDDRRRRDAARIGGFHADAVAEWLDELTREAKGRGYHARAAAEIGTLVLISPLERSSVLGTMDAALLPFKHRRTRELNV